MKRTAASEPMGQMGPMSPMGPMSHISPMIPISPAKTEVESDDPFQAVATRLPSPPGYDGMGEMARCMVEEYAMMGFSEALLMKMFKNPHYQALHGVYEARGEEYVAELLCKVFQGCPSLEAGVGVGERDSSRSVAEENPPVSSGHSPTPQTSPSRERESTGVPHA